MPSLFRRRHEPEDIKPLPAPSEGVEVSGLEHIKSLEQMEKKAYNLDPNMPLDVLNELDAAIATGNVEKGAEIEQALMDDNSPYPEVCLFYLRSILWCPLPESTSLAMEGNERIIRCFPFP